VLVVDDEPAVARVTAELLRRTGYAVEVANSGGEAVERVRRHAPDAMLLDYEMTDMDASEVLDALRAGDAPIGFPILIFTGARLSAADQVLALERGATDYVPKGSDRQVLVARLRAALRNRAGASVLQKGALRIDVRSARAWLGARALDLDRIPLLVLHHLAVREGEVVSKAELLTAVWGTRFGGFEHAVEQAVYTIRAAIGDKRWIETVQRAGYRFVTLDG
jgi:DNA-binding response OmpR family regulator